MNQLILHLAEANQLFLAFILFSTLLGAIIAMLIQFFISSKREASLGKLTSQMSELTIANRAFESKNAELSSSNKGLRTDRENHFLGIISSSTELQNIIKSSNFSFGDLKAKLDHICHLQSLKQQVAGQGKPGLSYGKFAKNPIFNDTLPSIGVIDDYVVIVHEDQLNKYISITAVLIEYLSNESNKDLDRGLRTPHIGIIIDKLTGSIVESTCSSDQQDDKQAFNNANSFLEKILTAIKPDVS